MVWKKQKKPRWYRPSENNWISWEIYAWNEFFITVSPGSLEIQINKWRKTS